MEASEDPNTRTLAQLKARIGEIASMIAEGDGSFTYFDCIYLKLTRHEWYRGHGPRRPHKYTLKSGQPRGTELSRLSSYATEYNFYTTSGEDAALFTYSVSDADTDASNGYDFVSATARPLPSGEYTARFHTQYHRHVICNFNPTHSNYTPYEVAVTAPAGALHEAFLDPVTIGTEVGADASNGVLNPTSFTVGETATQISSLKWGNNQVVITLDTFILLSGYVLDLIDLDGSVSLSLSVDDATVDDGAVMYSWVVETQPWEEGDLLMLRIREG